MVLSHNVNKGGGELPRKLIDIYFTLFRLVLNKEIGVAAELKAAQDIKDEEEAASGKSKKTSAHKASRKPKHGTRQSPCTVRTLCCSLTSLRSSAYMR